MVTADNGVGQTTSAILSNQKTLVASGESTEATTITVLGSATIIYASQTRGVASPSGPWDQVQLTSGGLVSINQTNTPSSGVVAIVYHSHTTYQENNTAEWWYWDTSLVPHGWSTNQFTITTAWTPISYAANAAIGTVVGNITTSMSDGETFTPGTNGTLTLSDNTNFKLSGAQIQAKVALSQASYPLTVTATPISAGVRYGPDSTASNTVAQTGTLAAPAQASAVGFTHLAFNSDFTGASEVTNSTSTGSGFLWYPSLDSTSTFSVNRTATAASINNGNSGGGNNASPAGGILTMNSMRGGSGRFISIPGATLNFNGAVLPAVGQGHWSHAYFEAYIQFVINGNTGTQAGGYTDGLPAFWSWAAQDQKGFGQGSSSISTGNNPTAEVDFMESYGSIFDPSQENQWLCGIVNHIGTTTGAGTGTIFTGSMDSNWHTYGMLWKSTGAGTGTLTPYLDNVVQASPWGTFTEMESQTLFMALSAGLNWAVNVDWVRVWTA